MMESITEEYQGRVATLSVGREKKVVCGGHSTLPFLSTPYERPLLALEVNDVLLHDYNHFLRKTWTKEDFIDRAKQAQFFSPDLLCIRFISENPDIDITSIGKPQELLKEIQTEIDLPLIVTGCGNHMKDEELIPLLSETIEGENALMGIATDENYRMLTMSCMANGHSIIAETPNDLNMAKQLNILISDLDMPVERVAMHPTTAALGYGMEYCYSAIEKCRLAALEGDSMLAPVIVNFVGTEIWKTKEAQESEELGINWEVITSIAYLEAGADIIVIDHPESLSRLKKIVDALVS